MKAKELLRPERRGTGLALAHTTNSNSASPPLRSPSTIWEGREHLHRRAIGYVDLERRRGVEGTIAQWTSPAARLKGRAGA
jgi:hypothetical protein